MHYFGILRRIKNLMVDETGLDEPKVDEMPVDDQDHTRLSCHWKTPARASSTRCGVRDEPKCSSSLLCNTEWKDK